MIFDGHLDLSLNAVHFNRDLTRSLEEIRAEEAGLADRLSRGNGTVCFPEMRRAGIGICLATQIGHCLARNNPLLGWRSPAIAWAQTQAQRAWFEELARQGELFPIVDRPSLECHLQRWQTGSPSEQLPIGYILTLEGADSLVTLKHLELAWQYGLRAVGPAHYGLGRYAPGTGASGGLEPAGRDLLAEMERLGIALDLTHLTDEAFWEALDLFGGMVWASHNNCRALVPHQRQFSDEQILAICRRDGVIGTPFDAWMMVPGWVIGKTRPEEAGLKLERAADHIDHICQLAGSARHCGIGSDLDGGFGREQTPCDLPSIGELPRLGEILARRGYNPGDVEAIMQGNWLRVVRAALPK